MILLAALSLATPDAHACSPGQAVLLGHSPADGAAAVPTDAVIRVHAGEGYGPSINDLEVLVTVDGELQPGSLEGWSWARDLTEATAFFTFVPTEALPTSSSIEVRVAGDQIDQTFTFETAEGPSEAVAPEAPTLSLSAASYQDGASGGAMNSCETESWRELDLEASLAAPDPEGQSWIVVHRVEVDGSEGAPIDVVGPLTTTAVQDMQALINEWGLDSRELGEECVAARTLDGTGRSSEASATVCIDPDEADDAEAGCSTLRATPTALGLALSLLGIMGTRRRRG